MREKWKWMKCKRKMRTETMAVDITGRNRWEIERELKKVTKENPRQDGSREKSKGD